MYRKGKRCTSPEDQRYRAVYPFGAVCPEGDAAFGLVVPIVSTDAMQAFLDQLSEQVAPGARAIVVLDRTGWRCANDVVVPENITPVCLSPCSPELDSIERLWLCLEERFFSQHLFSHRFWADCVARQRVAGEAGRIKSLCSINWPKTVTK